MAQNSSPRQSPTIPDAAFLAAVFREPDRDGRIAAHVRRAYDQAYPGARNSTLEAEVVGDLLAILRAEQRRCAELKQRCDLLTERHLGHREVPLTGHVRLSFTLMAGTAYAGIVVGTGALAEYAADSGVVAALDNSFVAAFILAFPVIACAQMLKAAGGFLKDDEARRRYYGWLTRLGAGCAAVFVAAAAIGFAPHPVDLNAVRDILNGSAPPPDAILTACKAVAPYLVVGAGLLTEVFAAAVIACRADQMNALGRAVTQGVSPTQLILDERIDELQPKIEAQARKAAALQASAERHEAAITETIDTAQAEARQLEAEHAAHQARASKEFLANQTPKGLLS